MQGRCDSIKYAFQSKDENAIDCFIDGCVDMREFLGEAAVRGCDGVVEYLISRGLKISEAHLYAACSAGNTKIVKKIITHNAVIHCSEILQVAATTGQTKLVEWLYNYGFTQRVDDAFASAIKKNYLTTAKCLARLSPSGQMVAIAAKCGHLDIFRGDSA